MIINTNNVSQETINSVLIDILKGAKDVGGEIYGASKAGIIKAVDFAQEQAPIVVQEFLTWNFAQSMIWIVVSGVGLLLLGYLIKKCLSKSWREVTGDTSILAAFLIALIFGIITFDTFIPNVEKMIKIKVAPRVYIIEWTSDQITGKK